MWESGGEWRSWRGEEPACWVTVAILVRTYNLPCVIDAVGKGAVDTQGVDEGRVDAATIDKAMGSTAVRKIPDDLTLVVDAWGNGIVT